MIELSSCPICNNNDIVILLSTLSKYDDSFRSHNVAILNHILKNVLKKEKIMIYAKQCRQCKQIFITPTFSPEEMASAPDDVIFASPLAIASSYRHAGDRFRRTSPTVIPCPAKL